MAGEGAPTEADPESLDGPSVGSPGEEPPEGVGESVARRGEDVVRLEGKEAGPRTPAPTILSGASNGYIK